VFHVTGCAPFKTELRTT